MAKVIQDWNSPDGLTKLLGEEIIMNPTAWTRKTEVYYILGEENAYYTGVWGGVDPNNPQEADLDNDGLREVHIWVSPPRESIDVYTLPCEAQEVLQLPHGYVKPGSEYVFIDGQRLSRNVEYSITYRAGIIRFMNALTGQVQVQYTHGETEERQVAIPALEQLENCRDNALSRLWDIPHREDERRAAGYERDGIPVIVHLAIEPCKARALQWGGVYFIVRGEMYNGVY